MGLGPPGVIDECIQHTLYIYMWVDWVEVGRGGLRYEGRRQDFMMENAFDEIPLIQIQ